MEFSYKNGEITISSDKKNIILLKDSVLLDELSIDSAGEYEKSGFLMYARESNEIRYYYFRVEGNWIGYIPTIPVDIDAKIIDFFGQLDILVAPFSKSEQKFLEQIEPKLLITNAQNASDLVSLFGPEVSNGANYKLRAQDISSEKTTFVVLQ